MSVMPALGADEAIQPAHLEDCVEDFILGAVVLEKCRGAEAIPELYKFRFIALNSLLFNML